MDDLSALNALLDLAEQLGITVRRAPASETGEHPGGALVRLGQREMLFLDPSASTADQLTAVMAALRGRRELDDHFIPPDLRDRLETAEGRGGP
jgi:hypothetical protein